VRGRPAPELRPWVDWYAGYRFDGVAGGVHRGLPSAHLTFIVSVRDAIEVLAQTDPAQPPASYGFVLGGLQARPALVASPARLQEGVAIGLTPVGCRAILGLPARALWDTSLEASDVIGVAAVELRERLHCLSAWPARFAACDEALARVARQRGRADAGGGAVSNAWRLVATSGGAIPVAELADAVGWGRRHLDERFRDEFGLAPKLASRVVRFDRARQQLQSPARPTLAEVAAACGYYDQPHLNRDFAAFAGCPPGEWMATELPSVQDGPKPHGAVSAA